MREIDINGKYISNAIGYCHFDGHEGALNHAIAYKHKCVAKKCRYLEKYPHSEWGKDKYINRTYKER